MFVSFLMRENLPASPRPRVDFNQVVSGKGPWMSGRCLDGMGWGSPLLFGRSPGDVARYEFHVNKG